MSYTEALEAAEVELNSWIEEQQAEHGEGLEAEVERAVAEAWLSDKGGEWPAVVVEQIGRRYDLDPDLVRSVTGVDRRLS